MRRPNVIAFALLAAGALLWISVQRGQHEQATAPGRPATTARPTAGLDGGSPEPGSPDGEDLGAQAEDPAEGESDAGGALFDGGAIGELSTGTPKSVVFGVVLVQYAGAQGAPPGTRSRAEARQLAASLAELAGEDFAAAVEKGDPGSTTNAGRMFRGVLEPGPEFVLFSLEEGSVSEPVDTPRGFWIVKRVD